MRQRQAADVARAVSRMYRTGAKPTESESRRQIQILDAVAVQARQFIPDDAAGAVFEREDDDTPVVLALAGDIAYALECLPVENEIEPAKTRCLMIPLDRSRDVVEAETRYRGGNMGEATRFTTWRFNLGGVTFVVSTTTDSEGEIEDDREDVARALASALGWRFGGSSKHP